MFRENRKGFFAADLKSDFPPGRSSHRSSVRAPSTRNGIEFCADKCCYLSGRHRLESGDLEQPGNAMPVLCFRAVIGEVIQQRKRVGFASTELRGHVEHSRGLGLLS